jgi:hypothetical protein
MPNSIDVAFRLGFHKMVKSDMAAKCRAMLNARPVCDFSGLEPGKAYCYKPPCGDRRELVVIGEVTPKRTQAVASIDGQAPRRIYRGYYTGTFSELDDDLFALAGINHDQIVTAAITGGLVVPPEVRREYPALFVEVPDRFAQANITAVERVSNAFSPMWVQRKQGVTTTTIDAQIEEAHRQIAQLQDTRLSGHRLESRCCSRL